MKPPSFLVVADSGHMKAYRFEAAYDRPPSPILLGRLDLEEAYLKDEERFTDRPGSFPSGSAPGTANGAAERLSVKEETQARLCRRLGEQLALWLDRYRPQSWWFAAPAEINQSILDSLSKFHQERLTCSLKRDLVHVPAFQLLDHFAQQLMFLARGGRSA